MMARPNGDETEITVLREQAAALRAGQALSLPANCLISASAVVVLWPYASHEALLGWLAAILTCNLVRSVFSRRLTARNSQVSPAHALRVSWLGALVAGCLWIVPLLLCDQLHSQQGTYLMFMVCGITAGAVVQGTAHARTVMAFVTPVLAAVLALSVYGGRLADQVFAANIVFYLAMLIRSSRAAERAFRDNSRGRVDATALAASLQEANVQAVASAQALHRLATRDTLTGLQNRAAFAEALDGKLAAARAQGSPVCLLMLDLDHFKSINDTLGHGAGDDVLVAVAARLRDVLRAEDVTARLGGDEFAIVLEGEEDAATVAERIIAAIGEPLQLLHRTAQIGASIGIASFPRDGASAQDLLSRADLALYAAKGGGRKRFCRFDGRLQAATAARHDLELDLPAALADGSIEVWFQPQVRLSDGGLVGLEALIRWRHPQRGWIAPPDIVAAAQRTHRAEALTALVLSRACHMLGELRRAGLPDVTVAVNVSPCEIGTYDLKACLSAALAAHGVPASRIEIEITEEAMIASDRVVEELDGVSSLGTRIAIDDFGAGYSSLAYLRRLRVGRIKIDKSFVAGLPGHKDNRILVQAILGIGRAMSLDVVAEGVEGAEEACVLRTLGCPVAQGYHFARPMPAEAVAGWIVQRREHERAGLGQAPRARVA